MNEKFNWNRAGYCFLGFVTGLVVSPLAVIATPILFAYWLYIYGDED